MANVPSPHPQVKTETVKIARRVLVHEFATVVAPRPTVGQLWPRRRPAGS